MLTNEDMACVCYSVEEVSCECVMETGFLWNVLVLPGKIKMPDLTVCNPFLNIILQSYTLFLIS